MARFLLCILLPFVALIAVNAQCRYFPSIATFEMDAYLGRWYLQYKYTNEAVLPFSQCWSWSYFKGQRGKLRVQTSYVNSLSNNVNTQQTRLWMKNPSEPSRLRYGLNYFLYSRQEDYQVIATDYANFTIEYQCSGSNFLNTRETVWVLTRDQYPHPNVLESAFIALLQLGLDDLDLQREFQSCQADVETEVNRNDNAPGFFDWLTGGFSRRIGRRLQNKSLHGFFQWLGL